MHFAFFMTCSLKLLLARGTGFFPSEQAATAVEYALLIAGIALAIIAIVFAFGDDLAALFATLVESMGADEF